MPKKRKRSRKQDRSPRKSGGSSTQSTVDGLMTAFVRWVSQRLPDAEPDAFEDVVRTAVDLKANQFGEPAPADWDAELLQVVIGELMPAKVLADDDYARTVVPALRAYLGFLKETGRWAAEESVRRQALHALGELEPGMVERFSGAENKSMGARMLALALEEDVDVTDEAQLAAFVERFNAMPEQWRVQATGGPGPVPADPAPSSPHFDVFVAPEEQEIAALHGLPVARQMTALLDWIGSSRQATSTGALRLRDIPDVAQRLGIEVPHVAVRSMWQLADLPELWVAATECGIIELTATTVRPGPQSEHWLHGEPADTLPLGRALAGSLMLLAVAKPTQGQHPEWLGTHASGLLATLIATAAAGERDNLDHLASDLADGSSPAGPAGELVLGMAMRQLEQLARHGIVTLTDTEVFIEPAVRASFIEPMRVMGLDVQPVDGEGRAVPWEPPADGEPPTQAATTYQLKVQLQGSRPPIWRRLRVPGETTLGELHQIIQVTFDWDDSHLHRFTHGEPYRAGVSYEPAGQSDLDIGLPGGGRSVIDEATVTLAQLAPRKRDRFTYLYDYGDDWVHAITVESIDAWDPNERLSRCTDGRRMAPHEDAGGVWGWEMRAAAALDDTDEEHEEVRDRLGLDPSDPFDPDEFDPDEVTRALQ